LLKITYFAFYFLACEIFNTIVSFKYLATNIVFHERLQMSNLFLINRALRVDLIKFSKKIIMLFDKTIVIDLLIIKLNDSTRYIVSLFKSILSFNINYEENVMQELN